MFVAWNHMYNIYIYIVCLFSGNIYIYMILFRPFETPKAQTDRVLVYKCEGILLVTGYRFRSWKIPNVKQNCISKFTSQISSKFPKSPRIGIQTKISTPKSFFEPKMCFFGNVQVLCKDDVRSKLPEHDDSEVLPVEVWLRLVLPPRQSFVAGQK